MTTADTAAQRFDMGRVATETFGLIGRNFVPFFVPSLVFAGLPALVVLFLQPMLQPAPGATLGMEFVIGFIVVLLITMAGAYILMGALTKASIDDLSGKGVSIGSALSAGLASLLPLLGLGIIVGLGVGFGFILLIVPGVMLAMRWIVSAPTLVAERKGVFDSMGRSAILTKGHRWAIFGIVVIYFIAVMIVSMVVQFTTIGDPAALARGDFSGSVILYLIVQPILQAVASMISTVGAAVIYFELRRIKEGVGVTELASVFE